MEEHSAALKAQDFSVAGILGRGAFGVVYSCRCDKSGSHVAVKVISKAKAAALGVATRVVNEVSLHCKMRHPNIVDLLDFFEDNDNVYLVTEACLGGDMYQYLHRHGPLPFPEVQRLGKQLLSAVAHMHEQGILHRDLKLSNLLLAEAIAQPQAQQQQTSQTTHQYQYPTSRYNLKVADYGLAVQLSGLPGEEHRTICGTPNYIAPEVTAALPHGPAADVYSAGCLLYCMLFGRPPAQQKVTATTTAAPAAVISNVNASGSASSGLPQGADPLPGGGGGAGAGTATIGYVTKTFQAADFGANLERLPPPGAALIRSLLAPFPGDRPAAKVALGHEFFFPSPSVSSFLLLTAMATSTTTATTNNNVALGLPAPPPSVGAATTMSATTAASSGSQPLLPVVKQLKQQIPQAATTATVAQQSSRPWFLPSNGSSSSSSSLFDGGAPLPQAQSSTSPNRHPPSASASTAGLLPPQFPPRERRPSSELEVEERIHNLSSSSGSSSHNAGMFRAPESTGGAGSSAFPALPRIGPAFDGFFPLEAAEGAATSTASGPAGTQYPRGSPSHQTQYQYQHRVAKQQPPQQLSPATAPEAQPLQPYAVDNSPFLSLANPVGARSATASTLGSPGNSSSQSNGPFVLLAPKGSHFNLHSSSPAAAADAPAGAAVPLGGQTSKQQQPFLITGPLPASGTTATAPPSSLSSPSLLLLQHLHHQQHQLHQQGKRSISNSSLGAGMGAPPSPSLDSIAPLQGNATVVVGGRTLVASSCAPFGAVPAHPSHYPHHHTLASSASAGDRTIVSLVSASASMEPPPILLPAVVVHQQPHSVGWAASWAAPGAATTDTRADAPIPSSAPPLAVAASSSSSSSLSLAVSASSPSPSLLSFRRMEIPSLTLSPLPSSSFHTVPPIVASSAAGATSEAAASLNPSPTAPSSMPAQQQSVGRKPLEPIPSSSPSSSPSASTAPSLAESAAPLPSSASSSSSSSSSAPSMVTRAATTAVVPAQRPVLPPASAQKILPSSAAAPSRGAVAPALFEEYESLVIPRILTPSSLHSSSNHGSRPASTTAIASTGAPTALLGSTSKRKMALNIPDRTAHRVQAGGPLGKFKAYSLKASESSEEDDIDGHREEEDDTGSQTSDSSSAVSLLSAGSSVLLAAAPRGYSSLLPDNILAAKQKQAFERMPLPPPLSPNPHVQRLDSLQAVPAASVPSASAFFVGDSDRPTPLHSGDDNGECEKNDHDREDARPEDGEVASPLPSSASLPPSASVHFQTLFYSHAHQQQLGLPGIPAAAPAAASVALEPLDTAPVATRPSGQPDVHAPLSRTAGQEIAQALLIGPPSVSSSSSHSVLMKDMPQPRLHALSIAEGSRVSPLLDSTSSSSAPSSVLLPSQLSTSSSLDLQWTLAQLSLSSTTQQRRRAASSTLSVSADCDASGGLSGTANTSFNDLLNASRLVREAAAIPTVQGATPAAAPPSHDSVLRKVRGSSGGENIAKQASRKEAVAPPRPSSSAEAPGSFASAVKGALLLDQGMRRAYANQRRQEAQAAELRLRKQAAAEEVRQRIRGGGEKGAWAVLTALNGGQKPRQREPLPPTAPALSQASGVASGPLPLLATWSSFSSHASHLPAPHIPLVLTKESMHGSKQRVRVWPLRGFAEIIQPSSKKGDDAAILLQYCVGIAKEGSARTDSQQERLIVKKAKGKTIKTVLETQSASSLASSPYLPLLRTLQAAVRSLKARLPRVALLNECRFENNPTPGKSEGQGHAQACSAAFHVMTTAILMDDGKDMELQAAAEGGPGNSFSFSLRLSPIFPVPPGQPTPVFLWRVKYWPSRDHLVVVGAPGDSTLPTAEEPTTYKAYLKRRMSHLSATSASVCSNDSLPSAALSSSVPLSLSSSSFARSSVVASSASSSTLNSQTINDLSTLPFHASALATIALRQHALCVRTDLALVPPNLKTEESDAPFPLPVVLKGAEQVVDDATLAVLLRSIGFRPSPGPSPAKRDVDRVSSEPAVKGAFFLEDDDDTLQLLAEAASKGDDEGCQSSILLEVQQTASRWLSVHFHDASRLLLRDDAAAVVTLMPADPGNAEGCHSYCFEHHALGDEEGAPRSHWLPPPLSLRLSLARTFLKHLSTNDHDN